MVSVEKGATDYTEAFYDVSEAYMLSAENMALCNIRIEECGNLQKKLEKTPDSK